MAFLSKLTARIMQPLQPRIGSPELTFHVFGKHPGWDDHMPDLGVANPFVLDFKQRFYVDALAGNINAGAWKHLPDAERVTDFDHRFIYWNGDSQLFGGIWSSSDGKGRTLFPLIGMIFSRGLDPSTVAAAADPILTGFRRVSLEHPTAGGLQSAVKHAGAALADRAPTMAPMTRLAPVLEGIQVARLLQSASDAQSQARLIYALRRSLQHVKANLPDRADSFTDFVRLPGAGSFAGIAALVDWAAWYLSLVGRPIPLMTASFGGNADDGFIDLIAGAIKPAGIFPLRASRKKIPLCTDIPFNLDPACIDACGTFLASCISADHAAAPSLPDDEK